MCHGGSRVVHARWRNGKPNDVRSKREILTKREGFGFSHFGHLIAPERPLSHPRKRKLHSNLSIAVEFCLLTDGSARCAAKTYMNSKAVKFVICIYVFIDWKNIHVQFLVENWSCSEENVPRSFHYCGLVTEPISVLENDVDHKKISKDSASAL